MRRFSLPTLLDPFCLIAMILNDLNPQNRGGWVSLAIFPIDEKVSYRRGKKRGGLRLMYKADLPTSCLYSG